MVSNSGTMSTASAVAAQQPGLLQQHGDLEQVGHRLALRDHVVRQRRRAEAPVDVGGRVDDRELGRVRAPNSRDAASAGAAGAASSRASSATRSASSSAA